MKFHNQRDFMGHKISNVTNKPLLHKKGKQWIVVAVSALILAGFSGVVSTTTHADTTAQPATATKVAQPSQNNDKSATKANSQNNNNPTQSHLLSSKQSTSTPTPIHATNEGTWGTSHWTLNNGTLTLDGGNLNGTNDFRGIVDGNTSNIVQNGNYDTSKEGYLDENAVHNIIIHNVQAPSNASGLFSGDNGGNENNGRWNHFNNVESIDLSGLNTSKTNNMHGMFHGDYHLKNITFGNFDTSNVIDMEDMFDDDQQLQSLNLDTFDTSNCNNFYQMFFDTPGLRILDISKFVVNSNDNVGNMFRIGDGNTTNLQELVLGNNFKINSSNLGDIGSNPTLENALNSSETKTDWSSIPTSQAGTWVVTNSATKYTVRFLDESNDNTQVGTGTIYGSSDAKNLNTLPIENIKLPNGYMLAPNVGTTAIFDNQGNPYIQVIPNNAKYYGTWGNANWILYGNGKLELSNGELETKAIPNEQSNDLNSHIGEVTSIVTNNVEAPTDSSNLFSSFGNATDINLQNMYFEPNTNVTNLLPTSKNLASKELSGSYYYDLLENDLNTDNRNLSTDINKINSMTDTNTTLNSELNSAINVINGDNAQITSNSSTAKSNNDWINNSGIPASSSANSAESWVNSYGSNASNAGSWYAKNSASVNSVVSSFNSVSNSAQSAYKYYSQSSASISSAVASLGSLNSAWTSASNAWSYVSSESASISTAITNANDAVNDYNNDTKSSLSTAYASANSAYTSLTSQKGSVHSAISRLNSMNNSFATAYNSATNAESYLEKNGGSFATLSNDISKDNTNLSTAISNKADNSTLTADSNALNTAINNAQSWINSNSASLNNASNEAKSASASANTNASNISSNSSSIASLSTSANTNSANASSSVKSLSNSANAGISNNSSSVASLSSSANTVESNNSANASNSVKSLSNSASAGINKNSNNINTNSNIASNGIANANASASASASIASSNAQSVANQNSASASVSAANANSNADSYALSLAQNATGVANANAGGIDNTMSYDDQTVQSLSNTVNANTISLANNDNDLYQSKENKPAAKKHGVKIAQLHQPLFYFYALKPLWLHTSAKFTKGNRAEELSAKHGYTLPITRIFKVNGALRFEVKIDGAKYFVTGNRYFARNAYIQPNEVKHNSSVKVLRAIREYKRAGFGKKNFIKGIRKGTVLPIKQAKTVANKQVTRLQLTNGHWITANKNLVKLI